MNKSKRITETSTRIIFFQKLVDMMLSGFVEEEDGC